MWGWDHADNPYAHDRPVAPGSPRLQRVRQRTPRERRRRRAHRHCLLLGWLGGSWARPVCRIRRVAAGARAALCQPPWVDHLAGTQAYAPTRMGWPPSARATNQHWPLLRTAKEIAIREIVVAGARNNTHASRMYSHIGHHFPELMANLIFVRKSDQAVSQLRGWLAAVRHSRWLAPQPNPALHQCFQHLCPEQALFALDTVRRVLSRQLPANYPRFGWSSWGRCHSCSCLNVYLPVGLAAKHDSANGTSNIQDAAECELKLQELNPAANSVKHLDDEQFARLFIRPSAQKKLGL
ncbi:hypothetical protein T492DRAFT_832391 [Pavlovales sp. CCMP2436]|nr:hypothetical protein T492DRAFT_832391 [Pavlovales sp. CCMP2436]